jgi:nitrite reductase/ring-hydroxylating ferredoxin subunit/uncharacterized membrane protein
MSATMPRIEGLVDRIEHEARLDAFVDRVSELVERAIPTGALRDALHGVGLGHPLHPMLTDLPIGAWTSAWILDIVGGPRSARAAQRLVGFGCLTALPTAVSGAVDWSRAGKDAQRIGAVHAASNSIALVLYAYSWNERRRGRRAVGIAFGWAGAAAATVGGYLGGHLVYRRSVGANRGADVEPPTDWTDASRAPAAEGDVVRLGDDSILVAEDLGAGIAARCSHAGGPLAEGEFERTGRDRCVVCPWHASTFRLHDGTVVHGPATSPQPAYDVRRVDGRWQVRARTLTTKPPGDATPSINVASRARSR